MTTGVITGGWGFVWAVYALSFALYTLYGAWVIVRWKRWQKAEQQAHRTGES